MLIQSFYNTKILIVQALNTKHPNQKQTKSTQVEEIMKVFQMVLLSTVCLFAFVHGAPGKVWKRECEACMHVPKGPAQKECISRVCVTKKKGKK